MHTYTLTVDADGHVVIPDTRPGDTITIQVSAMPARPEPLTLATATTPEEREAVIAAIRANARKLQELLKDEPPFSIDELYGEDGLPR
jgi:hypothetical protein